MSQRIVVPTRGAHDHHAHERIHFFRGRLVAHRLDVPAGPPVSRAARLRNRLRPGDHLCRIPAKNRRLINSAQTEALITCIRLLCATNVARAKVVETSKTRLFRVATSCDTDSLIASDSGKGLNDVMPDPNADAQPTAAGGRFASTHWSVVLAAARTASPEAEAALEKLCIAYWYLLYAYLRRSGLAAHNAEDLTQEFFASRIVTKRIFQGMEPGAGRFRSWLLTSLQNLVKNEREKAQAAKRGGTQPHLPLDFQSAEGRYAADPAHELTPEKLYDRSCALQLLDLALDQLREKYRRDGKANWFEELKNFLPGGHSTRPYADIAARMDKSEDAVKMAASRLRQEYGRLLKAEVMRIVASPAQVEDELRSLLGALENR